MDLTYDPTVDAASVVVGPPIEPGGPHHKERIDRDRLIRYRDTDGAILEYEFHHVKRHGVKLDDLTHREELARLFADMGVHERDWSTPLDRGKRTIRRRHESAAG